MHPGPGVLACAHPALQLALDSWQPANTLRHLWVLVPMEILSQQGRWQMLLQSLPDPLNRGCERSVKDQFVNILGSASHVVSLLS